MSKHSHRSKAVGMNGGHEVAILGAVQGLNGLEPDFAIRRVTGSKEGVRRGAQALVDQFLRSGGELPIPNLDQPINVGNTALAGTVEGVE